MPLMIVLFFCNKVKISVDFSQKLCYPCIHELRSCSQFANSEQKKKMLYFCNRHKKSVDKASDPVILDSVELIVIQQKFFKKLSVIFTAIVYRLGQRLFKPLSGVRFPVAVPYQSIIQVGLNSRFNYLGIMG